MVQQEIVYISPAILNTKAGLLTGLIKPYRRCTHHRTGFHAFSVAADVVFLLTIK